MRPDYSPNGQLFNIRDVLSLRRSAPTGNCRLSPELRKQIKCPDGNQRCADHEGHPKRLSAAQIAAESAFLAPIIFSNLGHRYLLACSALLLVTFWKTM